jgi:hypothetical protein
MTPISPGKCMPRNIFQALYPSCVTFRASCLLLYRHEASCHRQNRRHATNTARPGNNAAVSSYGNNIKDMTTPSAKLDMRVRQLHILQGYYSASVTYNCDFLFNTQKNNNNKHSINAATCFRLRVHLQARGCIIFKCKPKSNHVLW